MPILDGHPSHRLVDGDPGIADQVVDPAELLDDDILRL
jgi:hypothetical protein